MANQVKSNLSLRAKRSNLIKKYPAVFQQVWKACSQIPKGKVASYGFLAKQIGHPGAARVVGTAMAHNPYAPKVPCHRVIRSDGTLGEYSAVGGVEKKIRLLKKEGVRFASRNRVDPSCVLIAD